MNPYIGPRPFAADDHGRFFGRDLEIEEITSHLFASRVLVLYAESGAGKTSLLNAGVIPELEQDFNVLPVSRVSGAVARGIADDDIENLAVHHALSAWSRSFAAVDPPTMTLAEGVAAATAAVDDRPVLVVFDQFEELFTGFVDRPDDRSVFFTQLRSCLSSNPNIKVLLSLREDFLAEFNAHVDRLFVDYRHRRYRLERLGAKAALQAVLDPLPHGEPPRSFADGVAERLVRELREVRLVGQTRPLLGEFVEPVQLQVVCETLWDNLTPEISVITDQHARRFGDVTTALTSFYTSALAKAVGGIKGRESKVRAFFDDHLITTAGTRGTVVEGETTTGDIPNSVVGALEDAHIVRAEESRGARWYELTHDRLIEPVTAANSAWRARRRKRWAVVGGVVATGAVIAVSAFTTAAIRGDSVIDGGTAAVSYRGADLNGIDFSDQDLSGEDFTGADLTDADFTGATLTETIMVDANLTGATFTDAILSRANLSNALLTRTAFGSADLSGAILHGAGAELTPGGNALGGFVLASAVLDANVLRRLGLLRAADEGDPVAGCNDTDASGQGTDFGDAVLRDTDLTDARLPWARLGDAKLDESDLTDTDLSCAELPGASLRAATLTNVNLAGADLSGAVLTEADLSEAVLVGVSAIGADFSHTTLSGTDFAGADLSQTTFVEASLSATSLVGATLSAANFEGVDLTRIGHSDLVGSNLAEARLVAATLGQLDLSGADLSGADLTEAALLGANLSGSNLTNARLGRSRMQGAGLRGTRLGGADLRAADLSGASLVNADLTNTSIEGASLVEADLTNADLTLVKDQALGGVDFSRAVLVGATFNGMSLGGLSFDGADLSDAHLSNAKLVATSLVDANMTGADLTRASLVGSDLRSADATGSIAIRTDFSGADLSGLTAATADLTDASFAGALLDGAVFDGANLTRANLGSVDLTAVGLRGVQLTDANLARTRLDGANLSGSSLSGTNLAESHLAAANLANADLQNSILIGADLNGANLTNTDLSGAVLTRATMRGASLEDADLSRASLAQADLTTATLGGADLERADLTAATAVAADLAGANLSGANLTDADFGNSDLTQADFRNGDEFEACESGPDVTPFATRTTGTRFAGADLTEALLAGVDLSRATGLGLSMDETTGIVSGSTPANLTGVRASGASFPDDMRNAQLRDAQLQCANFTDSDMTLSDLRGADMMGATLKRVQMIDREIGIGATGDWVAPSPRTMLERAVLSNVDLSGSTLLAVVFDDVDDMHSADLSGAMLRESSFVTATLSDANFSGATLGVQSFSEVDDPFGPSLLRDAKLDNANFEAADLRDVDFSGADLSYAVLSNAIADGVDLATATIRYSQLDVRSNSLATYPSGFAPPVVVGNTGFSTTPSVGVDSGDGGIWTTNGSTFTRIDPFSLTPLETITPDEDLDIREFAVAADAIWAVIAEVSGPRIARIDGTGKVLSTTLPNEDLNFDGTMKLNVIADHAWITQHQGFRGEGFVTQASFDGAAIVTDFKELPSHVFGVTVTEGFVWVASEPLTSVFATGQLDRIDWATGDVARFPVGGPAKSVVAFGDYLWIVAEDPSVDPDDYNSGGLFRLRIDEAVAWDGSGTPPFAELVMTAAHGSEVVVAEDLLWISQQGEQAIVSVDPDSLTLTTRLCTVLGRLRLVCGNPDRDAGVLEDLVFEPESRTFWAITWDRNNPLWWEFYEEPDLVFKLSRVQLQPSLPSAGGTP